MKGNYIQHKGFTLIELLIAVAIVALLAGIAYPSYMESVTKARRSDAKIALEKAAAEQEKWFFQNNGYTDSVDDLGGTSGTLNSPEGYYTITLDNLSGTGNCVGGVGVPYNCFTLTAAPVAGGPQASDAKCTSFLLSHTGNRTATGSDSNNCW
jgi:type IV pilus assembly protein PilE